MSLFFSKCYLQLIKRIQFYCKFKKNYSFCISKTKNEFTAIICSAKNLRETIVTLKFKNKKKVNVFNLTSNIKRLMKKIVCLWIKTNK